MEKNVKLKTGDGHVIHGTLNTGTKTSKILVIFVHGLTGHQHEHNFHTAASQFPKKGVDVFRFSLYTDEKGGRRLSACTIQTHAEDLNIVTKHFRKKYKTIAVVGHSLGSPTILLSDRSVFDVVVLWDPAYLATGSDELPKKAKLGDTEVCIQEWGVEFLMNPTMVKEWKGFDGVNELHLIENLDKPLKIIAAGKGVLVKGSRAYFKSAKDPKDLVIITDATHCFDEIGKEEELLKETLSWVKKHALK